MFDPIRAVTATAETVSETPREPASADAAEPPAGVEILPPPHAPRDSITGISVLVIDGNRFYRDLIKSALASQGVWAFIEASTIAEAKKRLTDVNQVDLIILEYELAGESGVDFARRVRRRETTFDPAIPIVMVSASTREDVVVEARNAGVHEFISKPFDIGTVLTRVKRPFQHPRKFIIAPNYVGPDRRWERNSNLEESRRAEDHGVAVDPAAPAQAVAAEPVPEAFESTIDKYQKTKSSPPAARKRKGLDRFKPLR